MALQRIAFDRFALDLDRLALIGPDGEIAVRPKSFEVLRHLLQNPGRIVTKDEISQAVWAGVTVGDESLAQCISEIRRALSDANQRLVKTVPRRGYMLDVKLHEVGAVPASASAHAAAVSDGIVARHGERIAIAVLPFEAMGSDTSSELEEFADGLSDDIIAGLSRIRALLVISSSTMTGYKRRSVDVPSVGRELATSYVLSGRVRKAGERLRLTAQLVETATGRQVWAAKFDRAGAGWFELQDDLTQCIVASVQVQLIVDEGRTAIRRADDSTVSADLLARSREKLYLATAESLAEVVATAERAVASDRTSGLACRLLSAGLWHQVYRGYVPWSRETGGRIMKYAERAVLSEDADEYSHWALALAHLMHGQHERSVAALSHALEINPSFSLAYGTLGTVHAWAGNLEPSIENNLLALRLNPGDPLNPHRYFGLSLAHYLARRYLPALEHATRAVGIRPDWWLAQKMLVASLAQLDRLAEARAACADLIRVKPDMTLAALAVLPFARPEDRDHVADGLRKCGVSI
jgi:adenylate cyclase